MGNQHADDQLVALDPRSLAPAGTVRLLGSSSSTVGAAATVNGADVWAGAGTTLSEITATTLHVARTLAAGGQITDMASSPDGRSLWDVVSGAGGRDEVQLRNGATGSVAGTWKPAGSLHLGGLTAENTGVWVAADGGTTTVLDRLQGPPIGATIRGGEPTTAGGQAHFDLVGQPIEALDGGTVLWTDTSGQALDCDTPTAGATRSKTLLATIGNLAATGPDLVVATPQGIDLVRPPTSCT